jgi:hypothetical protein
VNENQNLFDPFESFEDAVSMENERVLAMEMATVCSPGMLGKKKQCRIYIRENPLDHGSLGNGKRYIPDNQLPAHAHVLNSIGQLVGFLNITGPRPTTEAEVWEYKRPKESKMDEYREDIVNWANEKIEGEDKGEGSIYNWTSLRAQWRNDHIKNK